MTSALIYASTFCLIAFAFVLQQWVIKLVAKKKADGESLLDNFAINFGRLLLVNMAAIIFASLLLGIFWNIHFYWHGQALAKTARPRAIYHASH